MPVAQIAQQRTAEATAPAVSLRYISEGPLTSKLIVICQQQSSRTCIRQALQIMDARLRKDLRMSDFILKGIDPESKKSVAHMREQGWSIAILNVPDSWDLADPGTQQCIDALLYEHCTNYLEAQHISHPASYAKA